MPKKKENLNLNILGLMWMKWMVLAFLMILKKYILKKKAVKSETGQKIKKVSMEDKDFMKEFNKARKQLQDYEQRYMKTKPGKAAMEILEQAGVISKIEYEFKGGGNKSGKVSRIKQSKKWRDFVVDSGYDAVDLADYGYRKAKTATNPVTRTVSGWFEGAKSSSSPWISHVKQFAQKNDIPYTEALKAASPSY